MDRRACSLLLLAPSLAFIRLPCFIFFRGWWWLLLCSASLFFDHRPVVIYREEHPGRIRFFLSIFYLMREKVDALVPRRIVQWRSYPQLYCTCMYVRVARATPFCSLIFPPYSSSPSGGRISVTVGHMSPRWIVSLTVEHHFRLLRLPPQLPRALTHCLHPPPCC